MTLPKNDVPIYSLNLKSNEKVLIKYRPFLVKEEKIMLMAAQSKDDAEIKSAINQIIKNCVIEPVDFDPDEASIFDVEWLLINLRIKSVGSQFTADYVCNNKVGDDICNEPFSLTIGVEDVKVVGNPKPNNKIFLSEKMGVIMKPPRFKIAKDITDESDYDLTVLKEAIVSIFDETQLYEVKPLPDAELSEWIDGLTKDQFNKIKDYLNSLPTYSVNKSHTCTKCGFVHNITVDSLASFF